MKNIEETTHIQHASARSGAASASAASAGAAGVAGGGVVRRRSFALRGGARRSLGTQARLKEEEQTMQALEDAALCIRARKKTT